MRWDWILIFCTSFCTFLCLFNIVILICSQLIVSTSSPFWTILDQKTCMKLNFFLVFLHLQKNTSSQRTVFEIVFISLQKSSIRWHDIEKSYWASPVRESANSKWQGRKFESCFSCSVYPCPFPSRGEVCAVYSYGCELVSFFLLRVLQNLLTENGRRFTPFFGLVTLIPFGTMLMPPSNEL